MCVRHHSYVWCIINMCDASFIWVMHHWYVWCILHMCDASLICVMHPSYVWCVIDMCHASLICVMPPSDGLCGSSWREGIAELLLCMMMRHWYGRVAAVCDVSLIWPSWWDAARAASRALFGAPLVTKGTYSRKRSFDTQKRPIYTQKRPNFAHDAVCLESA